MDFISLFQNLTDLSDKEISTIKRDLDKKEIENITELTLYLLMKFAELKNLNLHAAIIAVNKSEGGTGIHSATAARGKITQEALLKGLFKTAQRLTKEFTDSLKEHGYKELRYVEGVGWCGIMPMCFTVGVMLDLDDVGPSQGRFCFSDWCEASHFLQFWDGIEEPTVGEGGCTANKRIKKPA